VTLERNVHLIVFLSILFIATTLLTFGLIKHIKNKKINKNANKKI